VELTVFLAAALALFIGDVRKMRAPASRRDIPPYIAAASAAACAGAALIAGGGETSVIRLICGVFHAGG
jgi:hypothetical protein